MIFLWKNNIYRDFVVAFIILISPFLFFLYKVVPKNVYEWDTYFFEIKLDYLKYELQYIFWFLSYKFLFIVLFCIWYLTCKHKWRCVVLIPLIIQFHELVAFLFGINNIYEHYRIYYSLIVSMPIILLLTYLSAKLKYFSYSNNINQQLDEEIDSLMTIASNLKSAKYTVIKTKFKELRKQKKILDRKAYLTSLIKLREEFLIDKEVN